MHLLLLIFIFITPFTNSWAKVPPNESEIYFHIHQATRWAELGISKKCPFSDKNLERHLSEIKYKNPKLNKSKFYNEYLYLRNHLFKKKKQISQIEEFRYKTHHKAEQNKIKHPENWQSEFLICSDNV